MSDPTVDVIIATNRASPFLSEALASVCAQTWTGWRIIIVDDGCSDPAFLRSAVHDIPEARIVRQPPSGLPAARNTGIRASSADLIAFLDDDDVWHPGRLAAQVSAWQAATDRVAVYCGGWYMGPDGTTFGRGWPAVQASSAQFLGGDVPPPRIVTLLVRRTVCESMGGFNETFTLAEDNEFILRLAQEGEMVAVDERLVGYRRHALNMSGAALEGRLANERALLLQIESARGRGDETTARLLRNHLRWLRRTAAPASVRHMAAAVRRADATAFARELAWATRSAPIHTLAALAAKSATALRTALRSSRGDAAH